MTYRRRYKRRGRKLSSITRAKRQYAMHEKKYFWHWKHKRPGFLRYTGYHEDCMYNIQKAKRPLSKHGRRLLWNRNKNN